MHPLSRRDILAALEALAGELAGGPQRAELYVVGGAAMVLLYDARPSTKDVDSLITGPVAATAVREAAGRVAMASGLPVDWLSDAAKGFVHGLAPGAVLLDTPALLVRALAPQQLLAMKLSAWRDDLDIADARLLLSNLGGGREEVWALVEPYLVPGRQLKARYAFDDLWEGQHGSGSR
jgi:hypothetical protein